MPSTFDDEFQFRWFENRDMSQKIVDFQPSKIKLVSISNRWTENETLKSKKVRVISKPSKKRQSIRYNELRFELKFDPD